jgi:mono/diheme cytochrome c family protein
MSKLRLVIGPILLATAAGAMAMAAASASRSAWDGVYSKPQAGRGQTAYNSKCARCHGDALLGGASSPAPVDRDFLEKWNDKDRRRVTRLAPKMGRNRHTVNASSRARSFADDDWCARCASAGRVTSHGSSVRVD